MKSRAAGRKFRFQAVSSDDFRTALLAQGVPGPEVDLVLYLFATVLDGRNTPVADGIERALGRPPTDFSAYARRTAATGVWGSDHA